VLEVWALELYSGPYLEVCCLQRANLSA